MTTADSPKPATVRINQEPLVSVLVPYFNAEAYIADCLASLAASQLQGFELCIYDDGSTVPLETVLANLSLSFDFPIHVSGSRVNHGASFARNRCLSMATGNFVCFLDSDDLIHPNRFSAQLDYLAQHPDVIGVGTGIYFTSQSGEKLRSEFYPSNAVSVGGFHGCCATFMLRSSAIKGLTFDEELRTSSEDVDFLMRASERGPLHNISSALYFYRLREGSLTSDPNWQADHTNFMVNRMLSGVAISDGNFIEIFSKIDGTQTGDLLVTKYWRHRKTSSSKYRILFQTIALMPKSFFRMVCRKAEVMLRLTTGRTFAALSRHKQK